MGAHQYHSYRWRAIIIAVLVQLPPGASLAGEASRDEEAALPDEEGLADEFAFLEMEAMVETAARHPQPLAQSPSTITLLTREDIEATGSRTLPEVLRVVPNMDVMTSNPFWYEMGVRGGRSTAGGDNVIILVDGRDLTIEFFGWPMWTLQDFSMDEVQRIEVVRGPGSALYGANAYAGVVQVFTRPPGEGPTAAVSLRGGEHGQTESNCRVTEKFGSVVLSASAGVSREDLWTGRDLPGRDITRGRVAGGVDLGSNGNLLVEAGGYQTAGKVPTAVGEVNLQNLVNLYGRARFQYQQLMVQAVYDRLEMEGDFGVKFEWNGLLLARMPPSEGTVDKIALAAQHSLEGSYGHLTYGAEYVFNLYHISFFYTPDQEEHRIGLYAQGEVRLDKILGEFSEVDLGPLILTAGIRIDENSITKWELSPRAALVWAPTEDHSFRLNYGHAFLKPKFFEARLDVRLEDVVGAGIHRFDISNPNLDNETIDSIEAGYAGSFLEGKLVLRLDAAYNWYRNNVEFYIDEQEMNYLQIGSLSIPDISGPGIGTRNRAGGFNGHNVELQVSARPIKHLRAFVTVGYRNIFHVGEMSRLVPAEPIWRLGAGLDLSSESGWTASVRAFYTDSCRGDVRETGNVFARRIFEILPDFVLLNARLAYQPVRKPFGLTAGVEGFNLLGIRHWERLGLAIPNGPDYASERLDRRIVLFLQLEI